MKSILLNKYGESHSAFKIEETDIPRPGKGEVTIKVSYSGLNFADVMARRGLYKGAPPLPFVLGYDVAGTIHEVGKGVEGLEKGQKVTAMTRFGGYAEYAKTQASGVAVIQDDWDMAWSTALTTQACTAVYCAEEVLKLYPGYKVLIQAASGGVGRILIQLAKHYGCEIFATASTGKQDYLRELGADHPIDYMKEDFSERVRTIAGDKSLDVVFDNLGGKRYKEGLKLLAPVGKIVSYGAADQNRGNKTSKWNTLRVGLGFGFHSPIPLVVQSKSMIGVNMLKLADHKPHIFKNILDRVIDLASKGIINPLLDKEFEASKVSEAHDYLESRKSKGKVVIKWNTPPHE